MENDLVPIVDEVELFHLLINQEDLGTPWLTLDERCDADDLQAWRSLRCAAA